MAKNSENLTPMMRQYLEIKQDYQDSILFFRLGDFYEMFFEDAQKASEVLEIALTSRNKNQEDSVPLCGIPFHSATGYIRKLIEEGFKVAICEQVEDPKKAKGIVKREVTRVITPGLHLDEETLDRGEANYLGSIELASSGYHLGLLDLSTGELLLGQYEDLEEALEQLVKHRVRELVLATQQSSSDWMDRLKKQLPGLVVSKLHRVPEASDISEAYFSEELLASRRQLQNPEAIQVLDRILHYTQQTQKSLLKHLGPVQILKEQQYLRLDDRSFRHLEIVRNLHQEGRRGTLFSVLNKTATAMGARRLLKWLHYPLIDLEAIQARLDAVEELRKNSELNFLIRERLREVHDIERMLGKLALATAHARDLSQLGSSLQKAQNLVKDLQCKISASLLKKRFKCLPNLEKLWKRLLSQLKEELPLSVKEGGLMAEGFNAELDELRTISRDGKSFIASLEAQERKRTQISTLKIRYNKVFGYYIEVTHAHKKNVPEDYIRKQTLTNAERFITPQLKEYESKVLGAEERIKSLEYELFCQLRQDCAQHLEPLRMFADFLADLDVLSALAKVARDYQYVRPQIHDGSGLQLKESRHPVIERLQSEVRFIPNDIEMDGESSRLFLITGPNMAGKSTVMRQVALTVIMAQIGSFVPAKEAKLGWVDQVFTRIGASDYLALGQSTFMVEMLETAHILKHASQRSLVVLDEIGRGTSTYDGMSLAWSIAEYVAQNLKCRALFATHYHELIALSEQLEGIANYQVAVKEWNNEILFLRKLIPGGASRSYGIEVARLAGLPEKLLARAKEVLAELEKAEDGAVRQLKTTEKNSEQIELFQNKLNPIEEKLRKMSPETMSPLEALNFIFELKRMVT